MLGIRLGEAGKGFITGLAESANEALKTDIKNINTRIDDLAKIKFDRALKDQDERKEEVREAEEILREAGAVFGDDPYAADFLEVTNDEDAAQLYALIEELDRYMTTEDAPNRDELQYLGDWTLAKAFGPGAFDVTDSDYYA